jgi:CheY-like chemotaxis protein
MSRLLLVDDNVQVRKSLRWFFEELDLDCDEADNGLHALQLAQKSKPDLVILDYSMPVMNGVQAAVLFNEIMPEVPILMLTAHSGSADESAKKAGVLGIYSKDNVEPLVSRVKTILQISPGAI